MIGSDSPSCCCSMFPGYRAAIDGLTVGKAHTPHVFLSSALPHFTYLAVWSVCTKSVGICPKEPWLPWWLLDVAGNMSHHLSQVLAVWLHRGVSRQHSSMAIFLTLQPFGCVRWILGQYQKWTNKVVAGQLVGLHIWQYHGLMKYWRIGIQLV